MTGLVTLRAARMEDAAWTHALRNLPHIRHASLDQRAIAPEDHAAWWEAALRSPDRRLCVILFDGDEAGVLRLDRRGDAADVSIYTRPALSGRGIGRQAILAAVALAREAFGVRRLTATIREENIASQRAFAAAGFVRAEGGWARLV